jgi:hypothetical protein
VTGWQVFPACSLEEPMRISEVGRLAIVSVAMTACGTAANVPSPSPPTTSLTPGASVATVSPAISELGGAPLGIVVKDFLGGGPTYTVSLIGTDGAVVASASAHRRSRPAGVLIQMPNVSASNTRLYFLDGDSAIKYLSRDGTIGTATTIPLDANSAAVFSVSPDDSRIAVAIITFPYPARTKIYVEDLIGGGHHVEIFSSSSVLEWPAGWHQGHLVIAVGINSPPQNAGEWFNYGYRGYHVADAATGARLTTVCDGFDASAPPVPAGTVCVNYPAYEVSDWSGVARSIPQDAGCGGGALSPDGSLIANCQGSSPRSVSLLARDGTTRSTAIPATPLGWIDLNHLVVRVDADSSLLVVDVRSLAQMRVGVGGFFAGSIPGAL